MKKILLALLLFAPSVWSAVVTSKPASTSDDWSGALNANASYNGAWLAATDSTGPGAGQASYIGWDGTRYYARAVRFPNISIPQGSTIDSAEYWVRVGCVGCTDSLILTASIYNADNASTQIVDTAGFRAGFGSRATSTGSIDTGFVGTATSWSLGTYVRLPFNKLDSVIQTITNRSGWTSGNAMMLFVCSRGGTLTSTLRRATREYSYSSGSTYDSLWISYTAGGGGSPSATPNVVIRTATLHTTTLRSPEKLFRREETWKW